MDEKPGARTARRLGQVRFLSLLCAVGVLGWTLSTRADGSGMNHSASSLGQPETAAGTEEGTVSVEVQGLPSAVVQITDRLRFEPNTVEITVGDEVEWKNVSVLVHTVTGDPSLTQLAGSAVLPVGAAPFNSDNMEPEAAFRHRFDVPGSYRYFCIPHEAAKMTGEIVVRERRQG